MPLKIMSILVRMIWTLWKTEWNKAELQDWGIEFAPERKEDEFKERFDAITDDTAIYPPHSKV